MNGISQQSASSASKRDLLNVSPSMANKNKTNKDGVEKTVNFQVGNDMLNLESHGRLKSAASNASIMKNSENTRATNTADITNGQMNIQTSKFLGQPQKRQRMD